MPTEVWILKSEFADAMKRAYPGIDMDKATLAIHPLDIDPHTDLPNEMNNNVDLSIGVRKQYSYFRFAIACIYGTIVLYSLFSASFAINSIVVGITICVAEMQSRRFVINLTDLLA